MIYLDNVSMILRRGLFGLRHRRPRQQNSPLPSDVPPNPAPIPSPLPAEPPPLSTPTQSQFLSQNSDSQFFSSIPPPITTSSFPNPNTNVDVTTFTTMYPITTILQNTVTLTFLTGSVVFSTLSSPTTSAPALQISSTTNLLSASPSGSASPNNETSVKNVVQLSEACVGHGIDATSEGVLATIIISSVIGLALWVSYPDFVL